MSTSLVHILPPIEADQDENEADARAAWGAAFIG